MPPTARHSVTAHAADRAVSMTLHCSSRVLGRSGRAWRLRRGHSGEVSEDPRANLPPLFRMQLRVHALGLEDGCGEFVWAQDWAGGEAITFPQDVAEPKLGAQFVQQGCKDAAPLQGEGVLTWSSPTRHAMIVPQCTVRGRRRRPPRTQRPAAHRGEAEPSTPFGRTLRRG